MSQERQKRPGEDAFGILMLALGLVLVWQSHAISGFESLSSPGAFPMASSRSRIFWVTVSG